MLDWTVYISPGGIVPSKSGAQHRLMEMVAHGGHPSKGGPPVSVAKEFVAADKGRSFSPNRKSQHEKHMHTAYHGED